MNTSRNILYYATAEAEAFTYLSTGEKVTSSASATSTSSESYEEAYLLAETIANTVSQSVAENNANIIAQSLQLATQFHSTRNNLAYFTSQAQLSDFHIPSQNSYYNILTNFESYKQINSQTTENTGKTMCFDTTKRYIFMGSNSQGVNGNGNIPYCRISHFHIRIHPTNSHPMPFPSPPLKKMIRFISYFLFYLKRKYIPLL